MPNGYAYTPTDISEDKDGTRIETVFKEFCREANIDFKGAFGSPALQLPLK